jgi:hypothetical protein
MERIQALIDKLHQQKQQAVNPAQLLLTVQLLYSELLKLQQKNGTLGTAKVAVTLPVNMNFSEEIIRSAKVEEPQKELLQLQEETQPQVSKPIPEIQQREYALQKPLVEESKRAEPFSIYAPPQEVLNPAFSVADEVPTLVQHQPRKELHETISKKTESLNDRLKQEKTELAHTLKEVPIKDLRKAVGINDRFSFVNELFRGDEAMYERSIKTINGFGILSEAEYWMNRELKFKLGWNDTNEQVQHFYQLVRRRFS